MLFSYTWLQEHIQGNLPSPKKVEELLCMHSFEVEGVEKKKKDWIFDVAVLAHRGDALGHRGLARELAAAAQKKLIPSKSAPLKAKKGTLAPLQVKVSSPAVLRYSALVVENVKVESSPQWLKERLESLGMNSLNSVVDITNYIMADLGQPLHAFDYDKIKNHSMTVREAKKGEIVETLDDMTFKLPKGALVIEDQKRLIDLAGIKGGKLSGIEQDTKNIVLQAATFAGSRIYQTKKDLGYTTPAADMYTHNLDPNLTMQALERAAELLTKFSGGTVVQLIDIYKKKEKPAMLTLTLPAIEQYLGVKISGSAAEKILRSLEFGVRKTGKTFRVAVPTFRKDVKLPQDLIEEVGRMYGYEKIKPSFPVLPLILPEENPALRLDEQTQDSLKEAGFTEAYTYSFIGEKDIETFLFQEKDKASLAELENPYSKDVKYLRNGLLENLLKALAANAKAFSGKEMRLFDIGKTFQKQGQEVKEQRMLAGVLALPQKGGGSFYEAKGVIEFLLGRLGITDLWYDEFKQTPGHTRRELWHTKKSAEIKLGSVKVGFLGIISPQLALNLKLNHETAAFVLNMEALLSVSSKEQEYRPVSKYPALLRDIAVLVPRGTRVAQVVNVIETAGGPLLADVDLFDLYEDGKEARKSLAFHLVYQSKERTLNSNEVEVLEKKITKELEKNPEWEIRR